MQKIVCTTEEKQKYKAEITTSHFIFDDMKKVEFRIPLIFWQEFVGSDAYRNLTKILMDYEQRYNQE